MPIQVSLPAAEVERFRAAGYWSGETLWTILEGWARRQPNAVAMVDAERRITYAELCAESERLAGALRRLGVGRGEVVGEVMPNSIDWLVAHLAVSRCGAVWAPFHLAFRQHEFRQLLPAAEASAIIVPADYRGTNFPAIIDEVAAALPGGRQGLLRIASLGQGWRQATDRLPDGWHCLERLRQEGGPVDFPPIAPGDAFSITFTSGTTGEPKGAVHTTDTSLVAGPGNFKARGIKPGDVCFCVSPFAFSFAHESVYSTLVNGATAIGVDRVAPEEFCRIVERERVTFVLCSPAFIPPLAQEGVWRRYDLSSVRLVLTGGTTVAPTVVRALRTCFPNCTPLAQWGMTECFAAIRTEVADNVEVVMQSVGTPGPGIEAAILDEAGNELPPGVIGELAVRGASLMWGYWRRDEGTRSRNPRSWFLSGDLATHDGKGYFQFVSRKKEVINRGGVKVYPAEVEAILSEHQAIVECAVVGYADERLGERACLAAVVKDGRELSLADLTAYLEGRGLARYKFPERLEVIEALPRNPSNKIDKGRLAKMLNL
ncbi:MAG: AMP-binding protein [Candidatus Tectomicrobia bacterium]|nr:AMP-binding protein [Candidatus Tectomicrobia bacterium]